METFTLCLEIFMLANSIYQAIFFSISAWESSSSWVDIILGIEFYIIIFQ